MRISLFRRKVMHRPVSAVSSLFLAALLASITPLLGGGLNADDVRRQCSDVRQFCQAVNAECMRVHNNDIHEVVDMHSTANRQHTTSCPPLLHQCRQLRNDCYAYRSALGWVSQARPSTLFDPSTQLLLDLSIPGGTLTTPVANRLIDLGADVSIRCPYRNASVLQLAVAQRTLRPGVVQALLEAGADPNEPNSYGETSLHILLTNWGQTLERGRAPSSPAGYTDFIVDPTPAFYDRGGSGRSLHAPHTDNNEMSWDRFFQRALRSLLLAGADAGAVDQFGQTPLHTAATTHNLAAIGMMIRLQPFAVKPCAVDGDGKTPLHICLLYTSPSPRDRG